MLRLQYFYYLNQAVIISLRCHVSWKHIIKQEATAMINGELCMNCNFSLFQNLGPIRNYAETHYLFNGSQLSKVMLKGSTERQAHFSWVIFL